MIHQPNAPLWQIKGWDRDAEQTTVGNKKGKNLNTKQASQQLHIAYHGGDHYDSVRRLGDTSHVPANIVIDVDGEVNQERCQNAANEDNDYDSCNNHDTDPSVSLRIFVFSDMLGQY